MVAISPAGRAGGAAAGAILVAVLLAGCERAVTAEEQAAADARDVAQVEALDRQKPPPQPLAPEPIRFDDIQTHRLFGAGCAFAPGGSMGAVLLAQNKAGFVKIEGRLVRLASDPGSTALPLGAWSRYTGREFGVRLTRTAGAGKPDGTESLRWTGRLTITDPFDQVVYDAAGAVQCSP